MACLIVPNAEVLLPSSSEWTLSETKRIKYMTEAEAEELMDLYELSDEMRKILWPTVGTSRGLAQNEFSATPPSPPPTRESGEAKPTVSKSSWKAPDPDRPLWLAAAWLCGASYSALAMLHAVSEQAIQQSVSRSMPDTAERHTHRLGYRLTSERIEELRIKYYSNVHKLRGMTPVECATWLTKAEEE